MTGPNDEGRREIEKAVRQRQSRRERWAAQGERPVWKNLSMIGALGWLIVAPTLVGVFVGRWLDQRLGTGVTFAGAFTFAGVFLGFWLAWKRMNDE